MNAFLRDAHHENLLSQTESIVKAVNQELVESFNKKREVVVLDDNVLSDLLWAAVDNFRMMRMIDKTVRENKIARA